MKTDKRIDKIKFNDNNIASIFKFVDPKKRMKFIIFALINYVDIL